MAVKYKVVERPNPQDKDAPGKFYINPISGRELNLPGIGKKLEKRSGLSSIDVQSTILGLVEIMLEEVDDAPIIRLGDFGTFYLSVSSEGAETPEEVNARKVRSCKLNFRPGKALKGKLKNLTFEKLK